MRNYIGWRYIIAIALPLLLASSGVISLTTDLLNQVAGHADRAENQRNRELIVRLLKGAEGDIVRLVQQNAKWERRRAQCLSRHQRNLVAFDLGQREFAWSQL
jgi:hypothetical protein